MARHHDHHHHAAARRRACIAATLLSIGALAAPAGPGRALDGLDGISDASGRHPEPVRFVARGAGHILLFEPGAVVYLPRAPASLADGTRPMTPLRLAFVGANPDPELVPGDPLPGRLNVLRGADAAAWRADLTRYATLTYRELWPGVDTVYRVAHGAVKRDFVVAPGADPADIALVYDDARDVALADDGALVIDSRAGVLRERAPIAYQLSADGARELVAVDYAIDTDASGETVHFTLGDYDRARTLVIDPGLDFAAYVGGDAFDEVNAVTTDPLGNIYLAGSTTSVDFPITGSPYQPTLHTNTYDGEVYLSRDAFVMKLDPKGVPLWATFLGGKTDDFPASLCLDEDPPDNDPDYICNDIIPSPWGLGGVDVANAIAVHRVSHPIQGTVYQPVVVGDTNAIDFPLEPISTINQMQPQLAGKAFDPANPDPHYYSDAFVARLGAGGSSLIGVSTYLGGSRTDSARGVAVDRWGDIWVTGITRSADFPQVRELQDYQGGPHTGLSDFDSDAFVAHIVNPESTVNPLFGYVFRLVSPLGGYGFEEGNAIVVDPFADDVLIAGTTGSTAFYGDDDAPQQFFAGGITDGFLYRLTFDRAQMTYQRAQQTFVGGLGEEEINDVARASGSTLVAIAGATTSPNLWAAQCAGKIHDDCGKDGQCDIDNGIEPPKDDAFVIRYDTSANAAGCQSLRFLGGEHNDEANALVFDPTTFDIFVTGTTWSKDFPVKAAFQAKKADGASAGEPDPSDFFKVLNNSDAFFVRLDAAGKDVLLGTFLGGTGQGDPDDDVGNDVAFSQTQVSGLPVAKAALVVGHTYSHDFPTFAPPIVQPGETSNVANGYLAKIATSVADMRIESATFSPSSAEPGETVTLTVKVRNDGPEAVTRVQLALAKNPDVALDDPSTPQFVWQTLPAGCSDDGLIVMCELGAMARDADKTVVLSLLAPLERSRQKVTLEVRSERRDPDDKNNQKTVTLAVGGYDLALTATCAPAKVGFESAFGCGLEAQNLGPEPVEDVHLELRFKPANAAQSMTFVAAQSTAGCAPVAFDPNHIRCPIAGSIAKDDATPLTIIALRSPPITTPFDARLELRAMADINEDNDPSNDAKAAVVKVRHPDVALNAITPSPEPVGLAKPLRLTIPLRNAGPGKALAPRVAIDLSEAVTLSAGSDARCVLTLANSVECEAGTDPANPVELAEGATITFTPELTSPASVTTLKAIALGSARHDDDLSNNRREVTSHVGWADVAVETITPLIPPVVFGETIALKVDIANTTKDVDADQVVVEYSATTAATGHTGLAYDAASLQVSGSAETAPSCVAGPPVRCTFPRIKGGTDQSPNGRGETVSMSVDLKPLRQGKLTHGFKIVSAATSDPKSDNNQKQLEQQIPGYDLSLALTPPADTPIRKKPARFEALVGDIAQSTVEGGRVVITYATGDWSWSGLVSHSQGLTCDAPPDDGEVSCALGPIGGITSDTATVIVDLTPKKKGPLEVAFEARGRYPSDDVNSANNRKRPRLDIEVSDLAVAASDPTPVEVDQTVTYTLAFTNNGVAASDGARLTHTHPVENLQFVAGSLGSCSDSAGVTTCTGIEIPEITFDPIAMTLTYTAKKSGVFKSRLLLKDGTGPDNDDADPVDNEKEVETKILGPDLRITSPLQDPANPVGRSVPVQYAFNVENPSTKEDAPPFRVEAFLDAAAAKKGRITGMRHGSTQCAESPTVSGLWQCPFASGLAKASAPGSPTAVALVVDSEGLGVGTYHLTARVARDPPSAPDPNPGNDAHQFTTTREGFDLVLEITRDNAPNPVRRDEQVTYHVNVKNTHQLTAKEVRLSFGYLGGFLEKSSVVEPPGGGGCSDPTQIALIDCVLGDLAKGEAKSVSFTMNAIASGDASLLFSTVAYGSDPNDNDAVGDDTQIPTLHIVGANLVVTSVTWPTAPLVTGDPLDLEVTLQNKTTTVQPAASRRVTLTHGGLGPGAGQNAYLTLVSSSIGQPTGGPPCVPSGTTVTCQLGALAVDEIAKVYLKYTAAQPATFTHTFTAAEPPGIKDEVPADNSASHQDTIKGPDLVVSEISASTPSGVGESTVGLAFAVGNASTDTVAHNVKLRYTLSQLSPSGITGFLPSPQQPGSCAVVEPRVIECAIGDLAPGETTGPIGTLWDAKEIGEYRVVVRGESDGSDAAPFDNVFTKTMEVKGPDIVVTPQPLTGTFPRRQPFNVSATLSNNGPGWAERVTLYLHHDATMTFKGATITPPGGTCATTTIVGKPSVQCELGPFPYPSQTKDVVFELVPDKAGQRELTLEASVQPDDEDIFNQKHTLQLDVDGADLAITNLTGPNTSDVNHDEELTFVVSVFNNGPADAIQPRLTHSYDPQRLAFVSASIDGTCSPDATGTTTCNINGLAASGGSQSAQIGLTYRAKKPGAALSDFNLGEPGLSDENPADNTASRTTTIHGADLGVEMIAGPDPAGLGQTITYTGTVTNHGPSKAKTPFTFFLLSPDVGFAGATAGCKLVSTRQVQCDGADMPANTSLVWNVQVVAAAETPAARTRISVFAGESAEPGTHPDELWVSSAIVGADTDADGVSSETEAKAPNNGDGNKDGVPDAQQPDVTSVPDKKGDYVTVETSAGALKNVASQTPPAPTPSGVAFPVDALSYEVTGLTPGQAVTLTLTLSTGISGWSYWKYGPEPANQTPHWYAFTFDGTTGAEAIPGSNNKLKLTLVDGGRGDSDLTANGTIVDPGAPALVLLVVDSADSGDDADAGDGVCDTGDGSCTLRAALQESNASAAFHFIAFDITATTPIALDASGGLPAITSPVVVDATTQPGWVEGGDPVVGVTTTTWSITSGDSALYGLSLPGGVSMSGSGRVLLSDGTGGGVTISTLEDGFVRRSRVSFVSIAGSTGARVEGSEILGPIDLGDSSLATISGNAIHDVALSSAITISGGASFENVVRDNLIGLDPEGLCTHYASDPNTNTPGAGPCDGGSGGWGVHITAGAHDNAIGGKNHRDGNVISANAAGGVLIDGGAHDNVVAQNLFGTDAEGISERHPISGTYQLENRGFCVQLQDTSGNTIGGDTDGHRNVCAGRGMSVQGSASADNLIENNWLGLDVRGDRPWVRLSLDDRLLVQDASDTTIRDNVVPTIELLGSASGTIIEDNLIGTDPSGLIAFYADTSIPGTTRIWSRGVLVHDSATLTTVDGNLISGSYLHGIDVWEDASFLTITDNRIGVDMTGLSTLPNLKSGIHLDARFGGTTSDLLIENNVVAGNGTASDWVFDAEWPFSGIWLREGVARATLRGNTVGLADDGLTPLPHQSHGIWASGAPNVLIEQNLVAANLGDGVRLDDGPAAPVPSTNAILRDNIIGTDLLELAELGNAGFGIRVHETSGAAIGGVIAGTPRANVIAHNQGGAAIWIEAGGTGNTVRGNRAYDNAGLGIDLNNLGVAQNGVFEGTTNNDPDTPVLTSATESAGTITIEGTHAVAASGTYTLDFYLEDQPDPSGHGEGGRWLGEHVLSNSDTFSVPLARGGLEGAFVTATATDPSGNTSELSRFAWIDASGTWTDLAVTLTELAGNDPTCAGCFVTWAAQLTVAGPDAASDVTLAFTYPDGVGYSGETAVGFSCASAHPVTTCSIASLPVGAQTVYFYGTTSAPGILESSVSVSTSTTDPVTSNDGDLETTTVAPADLAIDLTSAGPAALGEPFELVAVVDNDGPSDADPSVVFALRPNVAYLSSDPDTGSCADDNGIVTCTLDTLPFDQSTTVRITVVPSALGFFEAAMSVAAPNPDAVAANDVDTVNIEVRSRAYDLRVDVSVPNLEPELGEVFDFQIEVENAGPSPLGDVVLVDTLQLAAYPVDAVPSQGICLRDTDQDGAYLGTVTCWLGALDSGATATVALSAWTDQSLDIENVACAVTDDDDLATGNDCRQSFVMVGAADLQPSLSLSEPVEVGVPLTLTATVDNHGPSVARASEIAVSLPPEVSWVSASVVGCDLVHDTQTDRDVVTCPLGDVDADDAAAVELLLDPTESSLFVQFTATSASDSIDPATFNDLTFINSAIDAQGSSGDCPPDRVVVLWPDTDESGGAGWTNECTLGGQACIDNGRWRLVQDAVHAGAWSWFIPDLAYQAWVRRRMTTWVPLTGDISKPEVVFHHRWDFQAGFDGGQLEVWSPFFSTPVYTENPPNLNTQVFQSQLAYSGQNPSWPAFDRTRIDLAGLLGSSVQISFQSRSQNDDIGAVGWWVDDFQIIACSNVAVETDADLSIALAGPSEAEPLVPDLVYQIDVDNLGPASAGDVVVTVTFPAALVLGSPDCDAIDPEGGGGLECALGDLAGTGSATLELSGYATETGDYELVATVIASSPDPDDTNDAASVSTTVKSDPLVDLALTITQIPSSLELGAAGVIELEVLNLGPAGGPGALRATIPEVLAVTLPEGCGLSEGGVIDCALGTISPGAEPLYLSFDVTAQSVGVGTLSAVVSTDAIDLDPGNDAVTSSVEVVATTPETDLAVSIAIDAPDPLLVDDVAAFTVTVENLGGDFADAPALALMPSGPADFGDPVVLGVVGACDGDGCTLDALAPGDTLVVELTALATGAGAIALEAAVTTDTPDVDAGNDQASAEVTALVPEADLSAAWQDPPVEARIGEPVTFALMTPNSGPLAAEGVVLSVDLSGAELLALPDGCTSTPGHADCPLGEIAAGASPEWSLTVLAGAPGDVTITAGVETATPDADAGDDEAAAALTVVLASADLALAAALESDDPNGVGELVEVEYTVSHQSGADLASQVELLVALPAGAVQTTTSSSDPDTRCVAGDDAVVCQLGALLPSATRAVDLSFVATRPGVHALVASVAGASDDPDPDDNVALTLTTIVMACDAGDCDDADPCTADACDPLAGCATTPLSDGACDDGDPCTGDDQCLAGTCLGGSPPACDDGDACTLDVCDPELGGCSNLVAPLSCDDGNDCTGLDLCVGGECLHTPVEGCCAAPEDCPDDDGDPCTVASCDLDTGNCGLTAVPDCCTKDSDCPGQAPTCRTMRCDTGSGECTTAPLADGTPCDADASVCTTGDSCQSGTCTPGAALGCDDGRVCTSDGCAPASGCTHTLIAGCCESDAACPADANPCTRATCTLSTGICGQTAIANGTPCDADQSVCTTGDACNNGQCRPGAALGCDDGDVCTTDRCDPVTGCDHVDIVNCCTSASACDDDADPCKVPACSANRCQLVAASDGTACDADGSACTAGDACRAGICRAGPALDCDDLDPCTVDACQPAAGCEHAASEDPACVCAPLLATTRCEGGDVIWLDGCDEGGAVAVGCDDADPASDDRCDAESVVCLHVPAGAVDCDVRCEGDWSFACEDDRIVWQDPCGEVAGIASPCASADRCVAARCDLGSASCAMGASGEPGCEPEGGCDAMRDLGCDGDRLVWRDGCGQVVAALMTCDDGDERTSDRCDAALEACVFTPRPELMPSRSCESGPGDEAAEPEPEPEETETSDPEPEPHESEASDESEAPDQIDESDDADPETLDIAEDETVDSHDPEPEPVESAEPVGPDAADDTGPPPDTAGTAGPVEATESDTAEGLVEQRGGAEGCGDCAGGGGGALAPLSLMLLVLWRRRRRRRQTGCRPAPR